MYKKWRFALNASYISSSLEMSDDEFLLRSNSARVGDISNKRVTRAITLFDKFKHRILK